MDEDVELIVPDSYEEPYASEIFTDLPQVQMQVHESDGAVTITDDITSDEHCMEVAEYGPAEYLDEELDNDVLVISDDEEKSSDKHHDTIIKDCKDNILKELEKLQTTDENNLYVPPDKVSVTPDVQGVTTIFEVPETAKYAAIPDPEEYTYASDFSQSLDNIEKIPNNEISKYDAVIEEYPNFYENMTIKEEFEPFLGTDYQDFNAISIENHHNDDDELPPEDIYHFNSKIILGSKPCPSTSDNGNGILRGLLQKSDSTEKCEETLYAKENLDTIVLLEDWGITLEESRSFCKDCGRLFSTQNALDAHNMTTHSFLVPFSRNTAVKSTSKPAYARKSTGTVVVKHAKNIARKGTGCKVMVSKLCNHCNMVFPDHNTLIKHLYEVLTLKQFKCNICGIEFKSKKELVSHNSVHVKKEKPEEKKEKTAKKCTNFKNKLVYEDDINKPRPESKGKSLEAIPLSVLFQCPTCSVNFTSVYSGLSHLMYCNQGNKVSTKNHPKCRICKRKFLYSRIKIHKEQHNMCTKFKVYKIARNIADKILCKCLDCSLHFSDMGMMKHLESCGKMKSVNCQKCNKLFPKSGIAGHMKLHTQLNIKPKDFIIVAHYIKKNAVKRKLEPPKTPTKKIKLDLSKVKVEEKDPESFKQVKEPGLDMSVEEKKRISLRNRLKFEKEGNKVIIYFCPHCKSCSRRLNSDYHINKHCKVSSYAKITTICADCGLQFTAKTIQSHRVLHTQKKITIHDMVFCHMGTLKRIVPSLPAYPQCEDCKIIFFCEKEKENHICGEDYETCNVCGEKFHNTAYNVHIEFHKLSKTDKAKPKIVSKSMPELIKKYKMLNMMWNIIYSCQKCEIVTDQYDKAVEHSQGHLNNEATAKYIKCYICNLKIDETCWPKHSELHSQMKINSTDFKILYFNHLNLLTEEWFELFDALPEDQIRQITDKSLYAYERRFKIKLLKEGRSEFTLYCCSECKVCCRSNEIEKHKSGACKSAENICKICSVPFCDMSTLRNHQILHMKGIKKEEFRVVMFSKTNHHGNEDVNVEIGSILKKGIVIKAKHRHNIRGKRSKIGMSNKKNQGESDSNALFRYKQYKPDINGKYTIYKCKRCKSCIQRKCHITHHSCNKTKTFKCNHCKEIYVTTSDKYENDHKIRHRRQVGFNLKNLKIVLFHPNKKLEDNDVVTEKRNLNKSKKKNTGISRKKSETMNSSSKETKTQNETESTDNLDSFGPRYATIASTGTVYKCECGLHYTTLKNIEKHAPSCPDTNISTENCSKCGLLFPTDVLVSHLCKHHRRNSNFVVENYEQNTQKNIDRVESTSSPVHENTSKSSSSKVKLYKCSECNIHFVVQNSCYKHVYKNHKPINPMNYIECKMCGLQFTIPSLAAHISKHHKKTFDLADVLVAEYRPRIGKEPLDFHVYTAADRVQSLQVTSSIEESKIDNSEEVVND